ncbi:MAG: hypothetical protein ACOC0N_01680 [Chroococcales cyanobacterium]
MPRQGVNLFLRELESHCLDKAIATFLNSEGEAFVIELKRRGKWVKYGNQWGKKAQFIDLLLSGTKPSGSLVLRSFTSEFDELTQLPIKELRGYVLSHWGSDLEFEKLPPNIMFACQNTDAKTGEPLPLEQSVRYC